MHNSTGSQAMLRSRRQQGSGSVAALSEGSQAQGEHPGALGVQPPWGAGTASRPHHTASWAGELAGLKANRPSSVSFQLEQVPRLAKEMGQPEGGQHDPVSGGTDSDHRKLTVKPHPQSVSLGWFQEIPSIIGSTPSSTDPIPNSPLPSHTSRQLRLP